jgi:phosphoribosylglycinamide formyltransferase-1
MAEYTIGILASGKGSNTAALQEAIKDGRLTETRIGTVISNDPVAGVLDYASRQNVPAFGLAAKGAELDNEILQLLKAYQVDLVVAAGYLAMVGPEILDAYPNKVVGIHPGPLPRFGGPGLYGRRVHQAVLDAGVRWSGPTAFLLDQTIDGGHILDCQPVPVLEHDTVETLEQRVQHAEHGMLWQVVSQLRDRDQ